MQRLINHLPLFAILFTGGVLLAQSTPSTAQRTLPYVGYLEENGVAVNGSRDVGVDLFSVSSGGAACDSLTFDAVTISEGRFQLELEDVAEACLKTGELYLTLSVGPVGGSKTALTTSSGGRSRVHSVPFALANDKSGGFLAGTNGGILFERIGGQTKLFGDTTGATGVTLQPLTDINDTNAIFLIKSSDGTERVRVNDNDAVTINEKLSVTGSSTLQAVSAASVSTSGAISASGAVNANGAALNVTHSSNSSKINFSSQGGSNNDPGLIEHFESGNTGELWISTSDDWDGGTTSDRVVFGQRSRNLAVHSFDAAGNAAHLGDLTLGGALSSVCPSGMSRIASNCIDNTKHANATFTAAMTTCNDQGKAVCTYEDLMMCDQLANPSDCDSDTNNSGVTLWTRTRHGEREDFTESWRNNLMCYVGNDTVDECLSTEQHEFYCCAGGIYSGTP